MSCGEAMLAQGGIDPRARISVSDEPPVMGSLLKDRAPARNARFHPKVFGGGRDRALCRGRQTPGKCLSADRRYGRPLSGIDALPGRIAASSRLRPESRHSATQARRSSPRPARSTGRRPRRRPPRLPPCGRWHSELSCSHSAMADRSTPSRASPLAIALPIPREPPATIAVLPSSPRSMIFLPKSSQPTLQQSVNRPEKVTPVQSVARCSMFATTCYGCYSRPP